MFIVSRGIAANSIMNATCFLFFSTSFTSVDNSSLISFSRCANRSLFSAIISCTRIEDCHAETKELDRVRGHGMAYNRDKTDPAFPSFMAYVSDVARAILWRLRPYSSSMAARFLKNAEAS